MIVTDEMRILLKLSGAASYTTTINEVTNVTKNYDASLGKLTSTIAHLVSAGLIVKFGKQCLEAASNLQEVANVVDVTFGASATKINNWAKQNASSFGLSETAAKRYAGTYGTMAKQFDMTTDQAAAMAIELTKLTGDVASFYNITDQMAATKLKAIFTGETEGLKELGVVMTQAQLDAYAMSKGWAKTTRDMTEQEKVALRYQYTIEKLSHAQGDFARTSDGYANSIRTLKLEFENLKIQVGQELLPAAALGIQSISKIIQAVGPTVVSIAQTISLYAQAWHNASSSTKTFATIALVALGVMKVIPIVVTTISKAFKLLFVDSLTLATGLQAVFGLIGLLFAVVAFKELSDNVQQLRAQTENLGETADVSTESVDGLADSLNGLSDSTKKLNLFLASFDEVNKVGGGGSLMSSIVSAQDLSNILGATAGIGDLQDSLNNLEIPAIGEDTIFSKDWWTEKGKLIKGFGKTLFTPEFWENWKRGIYDIDAKIQELVPQWHKKFQDLGVTIYDALHDEDEDTGGSKPGALMGFASMFKYEYDKFKENQNYASAPAAAKTTTTTTTNITNNYTSQASERPIYVQVDGRTIASVVADRLNASGRSSGQTKIRR